MGAKIGILAIIVCVLVFIIGTLVASLTHQVNRFEEVKFGFIIEPLLGYICVEKRLKVVGFTTR